MVATNVGGDRKDDDSDKNNTGGHHGNGVEDTGHKISNPEKRGAAIVDSE